MRFTIFVKPISYQHDHKHSTGQISYLLSKVTVHMNVLYHEIEIQLANVLFYYKYIQYFKFYGKFMSNYNSLSLVS